MSPLMIATMANRLVQRLQAAGIIWPEFKADEPPPPPAYRLYIEHVTEVLMGGIMAEGDHLLEPVKVFEVPRLTREDADQLWQAVVVAACERCMDHPMLAAAIKLKLAHGLDGEGHDEKNLRAMLGPPSSVAGFKLLWSDQPGEEPSRADGGER